MTFQNAQITIKMTGFQQNVCPTIVNMTTYSSILLQYSLVYIHSFSASCTMSSFFYVCIVCSVYIQTTACSGLQIWLGEKSFQPWVLPIYLNILVHQNCHNLVYIYSMRDLSILRKLSFSWSIHGKLAVHLSNLNILVMF